MLRDLQETDVKAICDINQDALGYSFSPEETASQLARLSQDSHHFLLGYEDAASHVLLGYVHAEVYESLYSKAGFNILALAVSPQAQGQYYERELDQELENLIKIVEPALILLMGLIIGGCLYAILSPMFDMISSLGQ